jgi:hypothetical protein
MRLTHANAPADQYAEFTATSTEIADRKTQLIWRRTPASGVDFAAAQTHCAGLDAMGSPNAFRLPTLKEALTLVDEEPHDEYIGVRVVSRHMDQSAFGEFPDSVFWTATREGGGAYTLNLEDATVAVVPANVPISVRCVRKF